MSFDALSAVRARSAVHEGEPQSYSGTRRVSTATPAGETERLAARMIASHDFRYLASHFRVFLFAGPPVPQAVSLVRTAYGKLGYSSTAHSQTSRLDSVGVTASLHAVANGQTVGALSVNLGNQGFRAEELYPQEVAKIRRHGSLCEFTQLATDTKRAGREVLCSLFYMAYVFSHSVHRANNLLIEVNPRHQCFYERLLGFARIGEEKLCPRVGAPAVLMHLDFDFTREQIRRARMGLTVAGTTLYRYAAPVAEEELLIRQITAAIR